MSSTYRVHNCMLHHQEYVSDSKCGEQLFVGSELSRRESSDSIQQYRAQQEPGSFNQENTRQFSHKQPVFILSRYSRAATSEDIERQL